MPRSDHWNQHARQWSRIGPPLRPAPEDVAIVRDWVADCANGTPLHAVLLGVTPELATMPWPAGTQLAAFDRCVPMIEGVWPADRLELPATALCGDWRALPLPSGGARVVIGDGCYTLLDYPEGYRRVTAEVRRVLEPAGRYIIRFFTRPEAREPLNAVFADLHAARIGNFHVFKWRLAMALHGELRDGVRLADVWRAWRTGCPDPEALARRLGWAPEVVATIDNYRDVDTRYTFPTLAEARAGLAGDFAELACRFPSYELGDRCPTLLLRPRA
jgi:SAM-dependent methyltransferase